MTTPPAPLGRYAAVIEAARTFGSQQTKDYHNPNPLREAVAALPKADDATVERMAQWMHERARDAARAQGIKRPIEWDDQNAEARHRVRFVARAVLAALGGRTGA